MKIAHKYILIMTTLIVATCSTIIFYSVYRERVAVMEQIRKKGVVLSSAVAMGTVTPLLNKDFGTLRRFTQAISEDDDLLSIEICDKNGRIMMHSNLSKLGKTSIYQDLMVSKESGEYYREYITKNGYYLFEIVHPIDVENSRIGYLYITLSGENAGLKSRAASKISVLIGLLAVTGGILSSIFIGGRISKPIIELSKIADEISHGNLDKKIEIKASGEVGILVKAFRFMRLNLIEHIDSKVKNERFALLGKLSSILAHEIRNPLEPIRGSAIMLKKKYPKEDAIIKYASIIEDEADNLSDFLTRFLTFSKPFEPKRLHVDINLVVENVLELTLPYINKRDINLQYFLGESLSRVFVDPKQLQQVLINLIFNAVDSMDETRGDLTIMTTKRDGAVQISIEDKGCGIEEDKIKKVFDPYFTTKEKGTGLGLTTSRELVNNNGGSIEIYSKINSGTKVIVEFPEDLNE